MIIGLTGLNASGKDAVADFLKSHGFTIYSLSDIIREECRERGLSLDRDNLRVIGNELRKTHGFSYLASQVIRQINSLNLVRVVIVSIRHSDEVREFKKNPDFTLLHLSAPIEVRFKRMQARKDRPDFNDSFEKFVSLENIERNGKGNNQQLDLVASMADHEIINDGSLESLYDKLENFIKKYEKE